MTEIVWHLKSRERKQRTPADGGATTAVVATTVHGGQAATTISGGVWCPKLGFPAPLHFDVSSWRIVLDMVWSC